MITYIVLGIWVMGVLVYLLYRVIKAMVLVSMMGMVYGMALGLMLLFFILIRKVIKR